MTCLACSFLVITDWSGERVYRCGHNDSTELDSHDPSREIVTVELQSDDPLQILLDRPEWCPLRPSQAESVLPNQLNLFD